MTVTLTYDNVNAKVSVTANQLGTATLALVERSINQIVWTTVRGGVAVPVSAGALVTPLDDYEFTPGVLNYYRVSAVSKGLYLPGTSGNYASTPDNAALDITSDIDLRADLTLTDWTPSANMSVLGKWLEPSNHSYILQVLSSGLLSIVWSTTGSDVVGLNSTVIVPAANGQRLAVRATLDVNNGASGKTATFYTAPTIAGPWTQLGLPVTSAGTTSIFSGTSAATVGAINNGAGDPTSGIAHAVEIRNGINGTVVANPDFTAQTNLAGSFTDAAGRVWTVNGTAAILTTQSATITPVLDRIWLKSLVRPFLNRPVTVVGFKDPVRPARSSEFEVVNRTLPAAINDLRSSRRWAIDLRVATAADAQTLDYILAAGDVMLLHVPYGCDVPGGYVQIKDTAQRHPDGRVRGPVRIFTLPLVEVAPPGPDVAATVGTWTSVLAGYASWDAVLAAFPTWADLLALHGDPSEVIVS